MMAFPADSLDLIVEAYFGGRRVDLTGRLIGEPVIITRGKPNGARQSAAGSCRLILDDDDNALTPLNPMSAYYPYVRRGVLYRTLLRQVRDRFTGRTVSNGWGTADTGQVWTPYSSASAWSAGSNVGAVSLAVVNSLYRILLNTAALDCEQRISITPSLALTGASLVWRTIFRYRDSSNYYTCSVELDRNTGSGLTVTCKIRRTSTISGTVEIAVASPVPGLIYTAGQPVHMRAGIAGTRLGVKAWLGNVDTDEPADWSVEVDDFAHTAAGQVGHEVYLAFGNTNTLPYAVTADNYELLRGRFAGTAASYRPRMAPRTDRTMVNAAQIEVGGLLRQLDRRSTPLRSALTRALPDTNPIAYWPLEDGVDSTRAASGLLGGAPMQVRAGVMDFVDDGPPGSAGSAHPDVDADNALFAPVVGGSATTWQMSCWTKGVESATSSYYVPFEVRTNTGKILRLIMQNSSLVAGIAEYDTESQTTTTNAFAAAFSTYGPAIDGNWHLLQATFTQSGANTLANFYYDGTLAAGGTWTGVTIGAPTSGSAIGRFGGISGDISKEMSEIYISHLAVHNTATVVDQYDPGAGWAGELAGDRIDRLSTENGVAFSPIGATSATMPMGPQPVDTLVALQRDCESTDGGILFEAAPRRALSYMTRDARYNQTPTLTVDLSTYGTTKGTSSQVLTPVYDDQGLNNDVEVTRRDGSSARVIDQDSIDADERYEASIPVNPQADDVLDDIAGWNVHVGTVDETRHPQFTLDLAATPALIPGWLATDIGCRVQRTNVPLYGLIDQILDGYTESLGHRRWTVTANCSPASVWDVAVADGTQRVPADDSTAATSLPAGGSTLLLSSTTANGLWIAGDAGSRPDDFPMGIRVGGERVTASAIGPIASDSFTRTTASGGWGTATSGQVWSVGSGTAANFSTNGTAGLIAVTALNVEQHVTFDVGSANPQEIQLQCLLPVTPTGAGMNWGVLLRWVDASNYVWVDVQVNTDSSLTLRMVKRVAGTATLISSAAVGTTHSTSVARILRARVDGNNLYTRVYSATGTDLGGWELTATDTGLPSGTRAGVVARVMTGNTNVGGGTFTFDNLSMLSPQAVTLSARAVNGVTRTWPAGTPVDVWAPAIAAL